MRLTKTRKPVELSAGSMADIAFLLLTFYMVTTVIKDEKGIALMLPPVPTETVAPVHDRNLFTIQINSNDQFLIEGTRRATIAGLRVELKKFIMNFGKDPSLSVSPDKAVISFKTDRGTSYTTYITTLDEIQAAYYEIHAEQAGITPERFRRLDLRNPADKKLYDKGRAGIPMNISISD
jgi:biopolymer transport protein ExbD